ncbi:MAG: hypothetical protein L3J82_05375 [Planctomycetes bacterium]|nr:hypothetical protein [Planctomycetota bacterium]
MEPREATAEAESLLNAGELQGAVEILEEVIDQFREYGQAYTLHAKAFLMAGDGAQTMIDLDAAERANQEYGTPFQQAEVTELRAVAYGIRTLYGGQKETNRCMVEIEKHIKQSDKPKSWWFLPAYCHELEFHDSLAKNWVDKLADIPDLKAAAGQYFSKKAGITQMLAMPKNPEDMLPVHYARHLRAKNSGDQKGADKYAKRMVELIEAGNMWHIIWLYASGNTRLTSV